LFSTGLIAAAETRGGYEFFDTRPDAGHRQSARRVRASRGAAKQLGVEIDHVADFRDRPLRCGANRPDYGLSFGAKARAFSAEVDADLAWEMRQNNNLGLRHASMKRETHPTQRTCFAKSIPKSIDGRAIAQGV
jgi:hypothetical protein